MNTTQSPSLGVEVSDYERLQREMHDALLAQHPEWIERDGDCPEGDDYDRRFAELLLQSLPMGLTVKTKQSSSTAIRVS